MNTLWTFGCSFTGEYYPVGEKNRSNYDDYKDWRGGNLPPTWPNILSNLLEMECNNLGKGASSNYSIFNKFCNYSHEIKENDIVVIGWTSMLRAVLVNPKDDTIQDVLISQDYPEFERKFLDYYFVNRSLNRWIDEIIGYVNLITEYSKIKGFKLFFWTSDDTILDYIKKNYDRYQDELFIYDKKTNNHDLIFTISDLYTIDGYKPTINQETNNEVMDCHMGEDGHKLQAEFIYNHIKKYI